MEGYFFYPVCFELQSELWFLFFFGSCGVQETEDEFNESLEYLPANEALLRNTRGRRPPPSYFKRWHRLVYRLCLLAFSPSALIKPRRERNDVSRDF